MSSITFRILETFPEPEYAALVDESFADYDESDLLLEVNEEEAAARSGEAAKPPAEAVRIGAFRDGRLVGWTYAIPQGASLLYMVNSGVAAGERRSGIYSELVRQVIREAQARGYAYIGSRNAAHNNAVIVAKLKLGFMVSGFEYSEVYGPLVRLTYIVGEKRRLLYRSRANSIRRPRNA